MATSKPEQVLSSKTHFSTFPLSRITTLSLTSLSLPSIRAFLFDMDGLLLNTESAYTQSTNTILARYNKPILPWSIKARLQGRPGPAAAAILHDWAQLPITQEEFLAQHKEIQRQLFPLCAPLPGVEKLLEELTREGTRTIKGDKVHIALATSSHAENFALKTTHLQDLFSVFPPRRRVLGDDPRIPLGRGKPAGDIYLLALNMVNETLEADERQIKPEECLVLEDSVPGVEAGRRAGMRVLWCPDGWLKEEFRGREGVVLAGRVGELERGLEGVEGGCLGNVGEVGDGWGVEVDTLVGFPYEAFGVVVGSEAGGR